MNASTAIKKFGLEQAFNYLYKDPKENLVKLMDWADKFAGGEFETPPWLDGPSRRSAARNMAAIFHGPFFWTPPVPATSTAPAAGPLSTATS